MELPTVVGGRDRPRAVARPTSAIEELHTATMSICDVASMICHVANIFPHVAVMISQCCSHDLKFSIDFWVLQHDLFYVSTISWRFFTNDM
jgi:hypothetical protein